MLNLKKIGVFWSWLVDPESLHDAEGRGTLQGADKAGGVIPKVRLLAPARHLLGIQKKAARMWVKRASEKHFMPQDCRIE